jgi:hypothetical protein
MDAEEFDRAIRRAPTPEDRIAWFAALLASEARTRVELVGGSAIEIYLSSEVYISQDVDVVGNRSSLAEVLRQWGFRAIEGRSKRVYWFRKTVGLVDLVGPVDRSGLPPRRMETPVGPVFLSAVEPLIVRRLVRSKREGSEALYRQAASLARVGRLDWEYLEAEAKFEQIVPLLGRLKRETKGRARPKVHRRKSSKSHERESDVRQPGLNGHGGVHLLM